MRSAILFLVLVAVTSPVAARQRAPTLTLVLGAAEMRLDMQHKDVIAKLTTSGFELDKVGKLPWLPEGIEEWNVGHKNSYGYFILSGVVDFRAGVLWRAGKAWYQGSTDADLAEALYGLSHNLKDERLGTCTLDTRDDFSAEFGETKHIALACGGKYVDVSVIEVEPSQTENARPGVNVWEFLGPR
jgi:hypothetical protein